MAALNKLRSTVYHVFVNVQKKLIAMTGAIAKPVKRPNQRYKNICGPKEQLNVTGRENDLLKKKAFMLFPLSNIKPDISTGKLPVPPGMIKCLDIYTQTINRQ